MWSYYEYFTAEIVEDEGKLSTIASIEFKPGGKTYDYLIPDGLEVMPGDFVHVPSSFGKEDLQVVKVVRVYMGVLEELEAERGILKEVVDIVK